MEAGTGLGSGWAGVLAADAPRVGLEVRLLSQRTNGSEPLHLRLCWAYYAALRAAGALPILLAPVAEDAVGLLGELDGLVLTGGDDLLPSRYGQASHPSNELMPEQQDASLFALLDEAFRRGMPILGICLGMQAINVHRGGTLHQHLTEAVPNSGVLHQHSASTAWHGLRLEDGFARSVLGGEVLLRVNSRHHQGVDRLGEGLAARAWAADGVIEALEAVGPGYCVGVQWHAEEMGWDPAVQKLYEGFVGACRRYRARAVHG